MALVQKVTSLGHAARQNANLKVRQPLALLRTLALPVGDAIGIQAQTLFLAASLDAGSRDAWAWAFDDEDEFDDFFDMLSEEVDIAEEAGRSLKPVDLLPLRDRLVAMLRRVVMEDERFLGRPKWIRPRGLTATMPNGLREEDR